MKYFSLMGLSRVAALSFSFLLTAVLSGCTPTTATPAFQASSAHTLTLVVQNATDAAFVITGPDEPFFEVVRGTRVLPSLRPGVYTVRPQPRADQSAPPAQQADLRGADVTLVFRYSTP